MSVTGKLLDKKTILFIILGGIFLSNAILAELIGVKIFSLESSLGMQPASIPLLGGYTLDFNLTAGVIIWPVVFVTTDIINEYFGKEGVKKITWLSVIMIIYVFIIIFFVTSLPSAGFWLDLNNQDNEGNYFNIDFAFNTIFRQGMGIIAGSLIAFLLGQLLDVFVFQKLRKITGSRKLWLRATGSTLVSQLLDSFVVLIIAFYIFGNWSLPQVLSVGIINYIYKFIIAVVLTPLLYVGHYFIDNYLGKETAEKMIEEAAQKSQTFF